MKTKPRFLEYSIGKEIVVIVTAIIKQTYDLIIRKFKAYNCKVF